MVMFGEGGVGGVDYHIAGFLEDLGCEIWMFWINQ